MSDTPCSFCCPASRGLGGEIDLLFFLCPSNMLVAQGRICSDNYTLGLGTGTDNRTGIFTGISPLNRYFAPVCRSTQCCSD